MMTGVTSIVGSGWLLSTQRLSNVSGPAAILTWVVGMIVAMSVALCFIEVGSSVPSAGGIGYYSRLTHGRFSGFLTSWINWLSIVTVPAIEAQAIVQYLSQLSPTFMSWYDAEAHMMSYTGIGYAIILMLFFMYINYWSVQLFIKFNNILTIIKVVVPILTIGCLLYLGMHPSNFGHSMQEFVPFGFRSIFVGVVSCGVVMSFNGFQTPMTFSTEIVSPKRQLPIAVLGSILITFILYLALQAVFIGAVDPLKVAAGWDNINFRSPYVNLLLLANFQVMVWVVYVSSALSPAACGAAFMASSSRMVYALSEDKLLPKYLSYLHPVYRSPRHAVVTCAILGCIYLFIFRSWAALVTVVSVLHLFSYLPAPIIVIANRLKNRAILKSSGREFRLPFASIVAPLIFICLSILLLLAAWPLTA
jgi:amino acid transporter